MGKIHGDNHVKVSSEVCICHPLKTYNGMGDEQTNKRLKKLTSQLKDNRD